MKNRLLLVLITLAASAALIACGGGGGSSSSSNPNSNGDTGNNASGVASAGAPISGAKITILSSNGKYFSPSATTGDDGSFKFAFDASAYPAPLIVQVSKGSGQSIGTYYSFVSGSDLGGMVITPISTAIVGLAANANLDQIFASGTIPAGLTATSVNSALQQVAKAASNQLTALGVTDPNLLMKNANYVANGAGQDAILDAVSISSTNTGNGSVLLGSKLTGVTVQIDNGQDKGGITSIPFSSNSASLLSQLNTKINQVNLCFKNSVNTGSSLTSCVTSDYLHSGETIDNMASNTRSDIGIITVMGNSSIRWCTLDTAGLTLESPAASLAGKTGICNASFEVTADNGKGVGSFYYKFTLNGNGTSVSDLKGYGNQLKDSLEVNPLIWVKTRVDGFKGNTGVTSGYSFDIGTALQQTTGNPQWQATSNISAKIEILDASNQNISTLYMECQQSNSMGGDPLLAKKACVNSRLTLCKPGSATCANGVDTVADSVLSVNSTLSTKIIQALQTGFVSARVTAYNSLLSDPGKAVTINQKTIPIIGFPIAQNIADGLAYPTLSTASQTAMAAWAGASSLAVNFSRGDSKINLYSVNFGSQPSAAVVNSQVAINQNTTSATFSGIASKNGTTIIPLEAGCSARSQSSKSIADWRGITFSGSFNNTDVFVKTFGSCYDGSY